MVEQDEWLTGVLGFPCFKVGFNDDSVGGLEAERRDFISCMRSVDKVFAFSKVPVYSQEKISILSSLGFYLVDTNLTFSQKRENLIKSEERLNADNEAISIRLACESDADQVIGLAGRVFVQSRFHADPNITKELANRIKQKWVRNFFLGQRGENMIVACLDSRIIGFLLVLINSNEKKLIIDLIGLDPDFHGKGLGGRMIEYLKSLNCEYESVDVGTQIANSIAIGFYQKNNFILSKSQYVFHYYKSQ